MAIHWDNLGQAVRAAGFVGPYMTPVPPDWPHLHLLLPTIDTWVAKTVHHRSAARAMLAIGGRMLTDQRVQWLPWLERYTVAPGREARFWAHSRFGDSTAGLLLTLDDQPKPVRQRVRHLLSIMADAGSLPARELLPRFAAKRSG